MEPTPPAIHGMEIRAHIGANTTSVNRLCQSIRTLLHRRVISMELILILIIRGQRVYRS